jgi:hypothetical protein
MKSSGMALNSGDSPVAGGLRGCRGPLNSPPDPPEKQGNSQVGRWGSERGWQLNEGLRVGSERNDEFRIPECRMKSGEELDGGGKANIEH